MQTIKFKKGRHISSPFRVIPSINKRFLEFEIMFNESVIEEEIPDQWNKTVFLSDFWSLHRSNGITLGWMVDKSKNFILATPYANIGGEFHYLKGKSLWKLEFGVVYKVILHIEKKYYAVSLGKSTLNGVPRSKQRLWRKKRSLRGINYVSYSWFGGQKRTTKDMNYKLKIIRKYY